MKTMKLFFKLFLPFAFAAIFFQGCYTQFVTMHEEEPSYQQEGQTADQNDENYYGEDNDNWRSHQYLGFSYYYPGWRSYWSWDYGCVYPSQWDPWFWGSVYYPYYSYYPHSWGYGYSYWGYPHYSSYGGYGGYHYTHTSSPYGTRNSGYQRSTRQTYGAARSGNAGTGTTYDGRVGSNRGDVTLPRTAGSISTQRGAAATTSTTRSGSSGVSTGRRSSSGQYNPAVQQPRHRDQNTTTTTKSSRSSGQSRGQGASSGQSRSSERSSAPSYTPQSSPRSSAPSSSPAPSSGGGGRQSGGSGRSR
jgi:hypothetical protein